MACPYCDKSQEMPESVIEMLRLDAHATRHILEERVQEIVKAKPELCVHRLVAILAQNFIRNASLLLWKLMTHKPVDPEFMEENLSRVYDDMAVRLHEKIAEHKTD